MSGPVRSRSSTTIGSMRCWPWRRAGDPLGALQHCFRILDWVPDLLRDPSFVENLRIIQAAARIKCADDASFPFDDEFMEERLNARQPSDAGLTVTWKVPNRFDNAQSAYGDEAPRIHGVPAGYVVPSTYIRSEPLEPDELTVVYFLLLLFSSALHRIEPDLDGWPVTRHSMLQITFRKHWKKASPQCQSYVTDLYRNVSGGRSLSQDLSLDADP